MSAFMCSDRHLSALAVHAVRLGCYNATAFDAGSEEPEEQEVSCFSLLSRENIASLRARYPRLEEEAIGSFVEAERRSNRPAVELIKACHCYIYQACEHPGWKTSDARKVVEALASALTLKLPGYEQAPWGI